MSLNFEKLKQDCDLYYSKNRELEINFSLENLAYTWGYTYFDTFSEVIKRVKRPKRFIIFGCSIGYQCFFWNFLFPDIPVIGIDILQHRINWGNSKIDEYSLKNVELFCGDINNFIIQDGDLIWQNDLLIPDDIIYELTLSNISNNDIEIISYNKMSCFVNFEIVNLTDEVILKSDKSYKIVADNLIGKTSWSDITDFFIYSKELVENSDLNNFVFGVEHICKEFMVPEINLKSYDDMNFSKRNVKSEDLRLLYNKYFSKKEFVEIGFNVPELYFYDYKKCDLSKILTKYDSFVAKPAHFSESVDVFIKKGANYNLDIDLVNKKLNDRIDISDKRNWRRRPIDVDIYWKNTERGAPILLQPITPNSLTLRRNWEPVKKSIPGTV